MNKRTPELAVRLDLELPEDRIAGPELDLIETHLGELLQRVLDEAQTDTEVGNGGGTVRPGFNDKAGR